MRRIPSFIDSLGENTRADLYDGIRLACLAIELRDQFQDLFCFKLEQEDRKRISADSFKSADIRICKG